MESENNFTKEELDELLALSNEKPERLSCGAIRCLIRSLLHEMNQPKVWDGAPVNAGIAQVVFSKTARESETIWSKLYRREIKKTRARQIAEEYTDKWDKCDPSISGMSRADTIEQAILKYAEENMNND